jgi:hypothetical protein
MDIQDLTKELKSEYPSLCIIKNILDRNSDLVSGILEENGSALHFAARNDTLYHNDIISMLLNDYKANPNVQNSAGSLPVFWGLAAAKEAVLAGKVPNWNSIKHLLLHPEFKINKQLLYRGSAYTFMLKEYSCQNLDSILHQAKWEKIRGLISLKQDLIDFSLIL